jgi:hypothetical protein
MLVTLEVAAKLLEKAQEGVSKTRSMDGDPYSNKVAEVLPKLWNALLAVLLTFRFDKDKTGANHRKFVYLRREASNQITGIFCEIDGMAREAAGTAQSGLLVLQTRVKTILSDEQGFLRSEVERRLDLLLSTGVAKVEATVQGNIEDVTERADATLAMAQENLLEHADVMDVATATAGLSMPDKAEANDTVNSVRATLADLSTDGPPAHLAAQRDDMLEQFGSMFKETIARQMEQLSVVVSDMLDEICASFTAAALQVTTGVLNSPKDIAQVEAQVFVAIEEAYARAEGTVSGKVQEVIDMLGGLMSPPKNDESTEDDEDDDDE